MRNLECYALRHILIIFCFFSCFQSDNTNQAVHFIVVCIFLLQLVQPTICTIGDLANHIYLSQQVGYFVQKNQTDAATTIGTFTTQYPTIFIPPVCLSTIQLSSFSIVDKPVAVAHSKTESATTGSMSQIASCNYAARQVNMSQSQRGKWCHSCIYHFISALFMYT